MNTEKYMNDETNEFPLAYFSFASSKDPDWEKNYPNTATMEVIVPTNFNNYAKWEDGKWKKRGSEYEDFKAQFSDRIISTINEHCPTLKTKFHIQNYHRHYLLVIWRIMNLESCMV